MTKPGARAATTLATTVVTAAALLFAPAGAALAAPPPARDAAGSPSPGASPGASRGASRGASPGASPGASRGASRGASPGASPGASRGASRDARGAGQSASDPRIAQDSAGAPGITLDRGAVAASVVPGRYVVVYRPGRQPGAAAPARLKVRPVRSYERAVRGFAANLDAAQLAAVRKDPAVAYVGPDRKFRVSGGTQNPAGDWGLDRLDQAKLPLSGSYTYPYDGTGVTVYMIDTGLRSTHSEFTGRVGTGVNFVNAPSGGDSNTNDCQGHGTHVAGTVGGTMYGVAKAVTIVPVRVLDCLGDGFASDLIAGVDWVTAHHTSASVANMSLGGMPDTALDTAVQASIDAGVTYTLASGNETVNACTVSPARLPAAITVGATTSADAGALYSNYGSCVDLYAPGNAITSAWYTSDTATLALNGTSMAAPHVAGLAAQLLQAHPGSTPAQIRTWLVAFGIHGTLTQMLPGDPNVLAHVEVDNEGPIITGISRAVSGARATATVTSSDATSVHGLSYMWSRTSTATTAQVDTVEDTTSMTISTPLTESVWYLHVRALDGLGMWSGVANSGPFVIDLNPPRLTVLRIKPAAPQRYTVQVAATDAGAGVRTIYVYWNHSRTAASGAPQTVGGAATVVSPKLGTGTWFAHIRVLDRANRWSGWSHAGPYAAPQKFVSGTVTQGARCSTSVRGYFGYTRSHVLERCSRSATSAILRWRPY